MADEPDISLLFEDFPELCSDGIMLEKELLAHFGLLFSAYSLLETSLQSCYVFWKLGQIFSKGQIKNQEEWRLHYDSLEKKAHDSTFGGLLRLLDDCHLISALQEELGLLKKKRDYFAHHFFREEVRNMFTQEARLLLMSRMNILRRRVETSEKQVGLVASSIIERLYPRLDVDSMVKELSEKMKADAISSPQTVFGWEK
ncbi:hypothetical protein RAH32_09340 [Paracoccus sp. WLY502]|uniref:hypothetical protein n=1 Tax=Paracoccus yibinensis TaxID=3068891 RepID=UPI002796A838|nr:hypothetical protein [Paracoccus sp. WLY502]MDQ1900641.1 hypothetical protein [Paracoccus sp. WLY502]